MLSADDGLPREEAGAVTGAGDGSQNRKPSRDNLVANFTTFMKNLVADAILPHLFQKQVLDLDEYEYFRKISPNKKRSEVVQELLQTVLKSEAANAMMLLHEALVAEQFNDLAELLCSCIPNSPMELGQAKKPRQWDMVHLSELSERQERLGVAVMVQILQCMYRENTAAEFIVGEGDEARQLLVLLQTYRVDKELLAPGSCLLLCDAAWVGDHLVVSSRNISRTGNVAVSEAGLSQADSLPRAAAAAFGTQLKDIVKAPAESTHSTTVEVVSVELKKQVVVSGETVQRRDFQIRDSTGEMASETWRHLASKEILPGQRWRFYGKVVESKQRKKAFRVIKADCVDSTSMDPDGSWLSSNGHQEGQICSFEIFLYDTCSKAGCSSKKLGSDKICKTCGLSYINASPTRCCFANLKVICNGAVRELVAFSPEVSQLYSALGVDVNLYLPKQELESQVLKLLPLQCGVRFDDNIITNIRSKSRVIGSS